MSPQLPSESSASRAFGAVDTARIAVEASPENVYAALLDRSRWVDGFVAKTLIDGDPDCAGERSRYRTVSGERLEEVLVAEPPMRYVTRLADSDDRRTHAFAEWRIEASIAGSTIEFNLYWIDATAQDATWPETQHLRASYRQETQRLLQAHLERIKRAVESHDQEHK